MLPSDVGIQVLTILLSFAVYKSAGYSDQSAETGEQESSTNVSLKYAVIVDCGSSGTRAHIFNWPGNATGDRLLVEVQPSLDPQTGRPLVIKIRPGLASLRDRADEASDYMKPVMDFISRHIPEDLHQKTPVYFKGTAGLRLLTKEEQTEILNDIAADLKVEYNFPHLFTEVIGGDQEGVYQWLSINSLSNRLNPAHDIRTGQDFYCQAPNGRRYGMLELGGASAQVTFEISPEIDRLISFYLSRNPEALRIFKASRSKLAFGSNTTTEVFSTTFLGLGTNSARDLAVDLLIRDAIKLPVRHPFIGTFTPIFYGPNTNLILADPCLPTGGQEVRLKPVDILYNQTKTIGYIARAGDDLFNVRLIGKGNYIECQILLNRLITLAKKERLKCETGDELCSTALLETNFVPFQVLQFLGLGELFYTTNEMINAAGRFTIMVARRTVSICSTDYQTLLRQYPDANHYSSKRTLLECFKATWMLTWLQSGIRMPLFADLTNVGNIEGKELDWALGAMISLLFEEQLTRPAMLFREVSAQYGLSDEAR